MASKRHPSATYDGFGEQPEQRPEYDTEALRLGVDPDAPWHWWMDHSGSHDPVETVIRLREYVEGLENYTAKFKLTDALEETEPNAVPDQLVELTGAWPVPDTLGRERYREFVNPNYEHARYYSDVYTRCECGALMVREELHRGNQVTQGEQEHAEWCPKDYRLRARADLEQQRRELAQRLLLLGHSIHANIARFGLTRGSLGEDTKELSIDIEWLKDRGRDRMARTFARLLRRRSAGDIGRAYDLSGTHVLRLVKDRTDLTGRELHSYRSNHD
jgi:hypothetical protein